MANVFDAFSVLKPDLRVDQLDLTPDIDERLEADDGGFRDHILVSAHRFEADWPTWEKHPGRIEFLLRGTDNMASPPGQD